MFDIAFAVGYGLLGLIGLRSIGARGWLARVGALLIVVAALSDEAENLVLLRNIAAHRTLTDGWIDAMQVPGTTKWVGTPAFFVVLVLAVRNAVQSKREQKIQDRAGGE